ncbi:MAG TPA: hypothetical protein VFJ93_00450 [Gaiellaceae bacterium]|nr:hypothetical protein [Gaiellaceae bacterium]
MILAAAVTVGALLYIARPLFGRTEATHSARADDAAARRLELVEERDRALAELKELEFDHRTGTVSDQDYRELVGLLRTRAVETLRALEPPEPPAPSRSGRNHRERRSRAKVRS